MQAVQINAVLPKEQERVEKTEKPEKTESNANSGKFLEMLKKMMSKEVPEVDSKAVDVQFEAGEVNVKDSKTVKVKDAKSGKVDISAQNDGKRAPERIDVHVVDFNAEKVKPDAKVKNTRDVDLHIGDVEEVSIEDVLSENEVSDENILLATGLGEEQKLVKFEKSEKSDLKDKLKLKLEKTDDSKDLDFDVDELPSGKSVKAVKSKAKFTVEDLRNVAPNQDASNAGVYVAGAEERTSANSSTVDMTLTLPKGSEIGDKAFFVSGNVESGAGDGTTTNAPTSFTEMLSQQLTEMREDFVRAGKIILKDNQMGSIRLNLQPEKLGNVKIFLEMSEGKKILGKIVVSSEEAYSAFKENLDGLVASFEDGGFDTAGFDLSWDNSGSGSQFADSAGGNFFGKGDFAESSTPELMLNGRFAENKIYGYGQAETIDVLA